jgi:cobalamin biosynthetic protein CobC
MLAAAPGTQILIDLLPRLYPARHVRILGPTYAEHAAAWAAAGAEVSTVTAFEDLEGAEVAVLCNPNNPDGRRHPPAQLLALAARQGARGGLLVVDEAFADLDPENQLAPFIAREPVILLRSFGKAYGLAGLRLGFALAAPAWAAAIRRALGPWPVSGPAIVIARQALSDHRWLEATRMRLAADMVRMDRVLNAGGLRVIGGTSLFRLAERRDAAALAEKLAQAGILVRCFPSHPHWLRFGIPGAADAWARLERVLCPAPGVDGCRSRPVEGDGGE